MPKTVLKSKFQEWKGLDRISQVVHEMNCIFREITKDDYGLDGEIEVVVPKSDGPGFETTGGIIKVQARSGESYVKQDSARSFVTPVEKNDLEGWYNATFPVLFIVYHPKDDKLYWKEIHSYVRTEPAVFQPPLRVVFDKTKDEFLPKTYDEICKAAKISPPRISLQQRERLYSNLLLVRRMPKLLTCAPTEFKDFAHIKSEIKGFAPPFAVNEGVLYTLADLRDDRCVLREFCETGDINDVSGEQWAKDESRRNDFLFLLNQLMGSHLWHCGLRYNPHFKRNYFPRLNDKDLVFRRDWYNVRTGRAAPARIVAKFYKYGADRFWRHTASQLSFRNIGSSWFLQIIPKYLFTIDGETPCDPELVGPYTTGIKASEKTNHVLNHVLFWADIISQHKPAIQFRLHSRTLMEIEKEPFSGIANFAIPNDPAIYEEDSGQLDFFAAMAVTTDDEDSHEY